MDKLRREAADLELWEERERSLGEQGVGRRGHDERLRAALWEGDEQGVREALGAGASPDLVVGRDGARAVEIAVERGDAGSLRALSDAGARLDVKGVGGETLLHRAAYGRNCEVVDVLVEKGVSVFEKDLRGRSALESAREGAVLGNFDDRVISALERQESLNAGRGLRSGRRI